MAYFRTPWADAGTRTNPPIDDPGDGSMSYPTGYGPEYEQDPTTIVTARRIERDLFNGLMFQITEELQRYQQEAIPLYITMADSGLPGNFPYVKNAKVRYDIGGSDFRVFRSLVDNNTELPTNAANWLDETDLATEAFCESLVEAQNILSAQYTLSGGGAYTGGTDLPFTVNVPATTQGTWSINSGRIVVPEDGRYIISCYLAASSFGGGNLQIAINGAVNNPSVLGSASGAGSNNGVFGQILQDLSANDEISLRFGTNLTLDTVSSLMHVMHFPDILVP